MSLYSPHLELFTKEGLRISHHYILVKCINAKGVLTKIVATLYHANLKILVTKEFVYDTTFFARLEVLGEVNVDNLKKALLFLLPVNAQVEVKKQKKRDIVIFVTKEHHCIDEIIVRHHFGELEANIKAVIGNHETLKSWVKKFDIPFYHISHENKTQAEFEHEIYNVTHLFNPEIIVLAKFMRILSAEFINRFPEKILNIHHSFLPAFIGSSPYKQAFQRGVKMIGATAHIVTENLDQGPIISQQVVPVDHTYTVADLIKSGKNVERSTLMEALQLMLEDKVFVSENKTIIFK